MPHKQNSRLEKSGDRGVPRDWSTTLNPSCSENGIHVSASITVKLHDSAFGDQETPRDTFVAQLCLFHFCCCPNSCNRIINFQDLMGIISILCCPEYYATGLKLAEDSKEGLCSNLCVACSCGFMTGFTSTPKENKKLSLNTLLVFRF
ncbi:uncharacterized protein TNCV_1836861 [Trichonephila clavipes]|nr:uncharacterized protein TNCV_1836861 [Trichonephila clavipes]